MAATINTAPAAESAAAEKPVADVGTVKVGTTGNTTIATLDPSTAKPAEKPAESTEDFGGFKSLEELKNAYKEARTKISQGKPAEKPAEPVTTDGPLVDLNALAAEYMKDGKLSEATLTGLKTKGFTPEMVQTFIDGKKAQADALVREITGVAGDAAEVKNVIEFVKDNATPDDIAAYNRAVEAGDVATAKRIFASFTADYRAADGEPKLILGGTGGKGVTPYESWEQVRKEMASKEYKTDAAFRQTVARRMAVTDTAKFVR